MDTRDEALLKSWETLADHLNPIQSFIAGFDGYIPVADQDDNMWYVLPFGIQSAYNVDEDQWYCLTSEDPELPAGDVTLGIILMIQHDTQRFLQLARKLSRVPQLADMLGEASYRYAMMHSTLRNEGDKFFDDECENCDSGEANKHTLDDMCDYHRGLFHGIEAGRIEGQLYGNLVEKRKLLEEPIFGVMKIAAEGHGILVKLTKTQDENDLIFADVMYMLLKASDPAQQEFAHALWSAFKGEGMLGVGNLLGNIAAEAKVIEEELAAAGPE